MKKAHFRCLGIYVMLTLVMLSCAIFSQGKSDAEAPAGEAQIAGPVETKSPESPAVDPTEPVVPEQGEPEVFDTDFPLPGDVYSFQKINDDLINYRTGMSMEEVIAFYRQEFAAQGLTERTVVTTINDSAFSLVFDGSPNGKAIVLQGFPVDEQTVNVSVRYEDV